MYVRLSIIFSSSSIEFLTHIFVADPRPIEERGDETDTTGAEQSSTKHASYLFKKGENERTNEQTKVGKHPTVRPTELLNIVSSKLPCSVVK